MPLYKNLTSGNVLRTLIVFSIPYLFSYLLQTIYGMADLFIIGQYESVGHITAVSIGSQVMHMITVMLVGLAMGSTVMIGRAVGSERKSDISKAIGNTVILFMGLSVVLAIVLVLLLDPIVSVMLTPSEAIEGTKTYLTICFIGIPCITAYNIISSIFRGMGDSKSPMYFVLVACIANIALDYLFIGAMGMGTAGAAFGTIIAQAFSVVVSLLVIHHRKTAIIVSRADFRPQWGIMKELLAVGTPISLQDGFIQISFLVISIIANSRGLTDAAAVGIVEKIIGILFLVPSSMLSAVSTLCAQNIGAGYWKRAKQTLCYAICMVVGFGLLSALLMQFAAEPVVGLFVKENDLGVIRSGGQYMRGYVWDCIPAGIHFCFSGYFCACKRSGLSFIHNVASICLARIPLAWLASAMFADTLFPMGLATMCGSIVSVIICLAMFIWLNRREK